MLSSSMATDFVVCLRVWVPLLLDLHSGDEELAAGMQVELQNFIAWLVCRDMLPPRILGLLQRACALGYNISRRLS